ETLKLIGNFLPASLYSKAMIPSRAWRRLAGFYKSHFAIRSAGCLRLLSSVRSPDVDTRIPRECNTVEQPRIIPSPSQT
ncbi:unnamed protein product, partial [Heterotrigona itama]